MTTECSWGGRVYTQLYSHSGRSSARAPSASRADRMLQADLCLRASLPPGSPRALAGALYIESITAHCQHVCKHVSAGVACAR